jgi:hypothetical protein
MPDWIPQEWSMQLAYAVCAGGGLLVVLLQVALALLTGGDEADIDHDVEGDAGLHLFSVRTVSAFFTIFGLVGWIGSVEGWPRSVTFVAAMLSGTVVLVMIALLLRMQHRLQSSGTVNASNAVGKTARVYLAIPAEGQGSGKITVAVQGRTSEYAAFTRGPALPTGSDVRVLRMTTPGVFEVTTLEGSEP